jgi:hypothetical protein
LYDTSKILPVVPKPNIVIVLGKHYDWFVLLKHNLRLVHQLPKLARLLFFSNNEIKIACVSGKEVPGVLLSTNLLN